MFASVAMLESFFLVHGLVRHAAVIYENEGVVVCFVAMSTNCCSAVVAMPVLSFHVHVLFLRVVVFVVVLDVWKHHSVADIVAALEAVQVLVVLHTAHMVVAVVSRTSQEGGSSDIDNYVECTEQEEHTEDNVAVHTVEDNNQRFEAYRKDIDWVEQKESKSENYTAADSNIVAVVVVVAAAVEAIDDSHTSSLEHVDIDHFLESIHLLVVVVVAPEVVPSSKSTSRLVAFLFEREKKRSLDIYIKTI